MKCRWLYLCLCVCTAVLFPAAARPVAAAGETVSVSAGVGSSPENMARLDSAARRCADTLAQDIASRSLTDFLIVISQHPAAERLRQHILARTTSPVSIAQSTTRINQALTTLDLYIADYAVRYSLHETSADSLVRNVRLAVNTTLTLPTGSNLPFPDYEIALQDTVARGDIPFIESRQYIYTQAPVPEQPAGFYSDIVEPLIIVSSAIITVILLFTVRSQ